MIVAPLMELLKKNSFKWTDKATESFNKLKQAMTNRPVLRLPNFSIPFSLSAMLVELDWE